jgi:Predicted transcriptional regulators
VTSIDDVASTARGSQVWPQTTLRILDIANILMNMQDALRRFKAQIFQALAHPTRIAIVEALHDGELSAGRLMELLQVEQANLSQHLGVLRSKQVLVNRKVGNQVYYAVRDPVLLQVLDLLRQYFYSHLNETLAMLGELDQKGSQRT